MSAQPQPKESILKIRPYVAGKSGSGEAVETIKLSSNENPLGPSPKAIEAFTQESNNLFRYPAGNHDDLRAAIAEVEDLPKNSLICGAGSDELIGMLIQAYTEPGDEVLYPEHGFLMYKIYALGEGAIPRTAPEKNYTTDVDALLAAVTEKTKIVFLANPNNPTGSYIPASELKRLRDGLPESVILAIDGAYAEYMEEADYSDGRELVEAGENTIMLRTFSKAYGIPALRVGWAYAPTAMIDIMNRIRGPFNVNSAALAAAEAAIRDTDYTRHVIAVNKQERQRVAEHLKDRYTVYPGYGNFLMIGFADPAEATAMNSHLLQHGVIIREIAAYGLPHCLRFSIGTPEENTALLEAIDNF
jgi:histidinol-phosphate aminotransferase